jgi:hypothetical protein
MADLGGHGGGPPGAVFSFSCQRPDFFKAFTTSGGM